MGFPGGLKGFLASAGKGKKGKAKMDEKEPKGVKDSPMEEKGEAPIGAKAPFPPKKGFGGK